MVSLKRYNFITINNRKFCYISFKTRHITLLNDIKHFTIGLIIKTPQFFKGRQFFLTETEIMLVSENMVNIWWATPLVPNFWGSCLSLETRCFVI